MNAPSDVKYPRSVNTPSAKKIRVFIILEFLRLSRAAAEALVLLLFEDEDDLEEADVFFVLVFELLVEPLFCAIYELLLSEKLLSK